RAGQWSKAKFSKARGVKGLTLGVVGLGNIGREVVRRAQAFDMNVVAWSRSLTDEEAEALGVTRLESPVAVAAAADGVSLHVAGTPETKGLADRAFFEAMKPGAFFVNTTRSSVVDEEALRWAMDEKGVWAAIYVMSNVRAGKEAAYAHVVAGHPRLDMPHHIGASTEQAQEAIDEEAVRVVHVHLETGEMPNGVNLAERAPATHLLTVRHLDRVG